ncbi:MULTISPECIES: LysR family transcriptional regulator [unclassified Bradyrhizobium]|nr:MULTISPECIES: LysR family transcriptional regulator [unclassified Bradyrhizobium]
MAIDRMKDISVFVHVAEAKSFTAAAERIGLSRSAVGKSIVRLEDRLGVRLLQRTTRSVSLTGEGAAFHERCVRLLADLDEAEMAMLSHSQAPRGRLRLDLPVSFGRLHVLPVLNEFIRKWPEISVSASFGDRYVDLIDEGVDLAIRIGSSEDSRLMNRFLARHRLVTCASPAYLAERGTPRNIDALAQHSCLAFVHGGRSVDWRFNENGQARVIAINGRFVATNAEALRDATIAGFGIARLATFLVSDDLRAGRLVPILKEVDADGAPIRAVYPSSRHLSPKVRTFIDALIEAWRPEPPWDSAETSLRGRPTESD